VLGSLADVSLMKAEELFKNDSKTKAGVKPIKNIPATNWEGMCFQLNRLQRDAKRKGL
jgi:hypothetical protein